MTNRAQFTIFATAALALGLAIAFDLHRVILRAVYPLLESFWFTYIAF